MVSVCCAYLERRVTEVSFSPWSKFYYVSTVSSFVFYSVQSCYPKLSRLIGSLPLGFLIPTLLKQSVIMHLYLQAPRAYLNSRCPLHPRATLTLFLEAVIFSTLPHSAVSSCKLRNPSNSRTPAAESLLPLHAALLLPGENVFKGVDNPVLSWCNLDDLRFWQSFVGMESTPHNNEA